MIFYLKLLVFTSNSVKILTLNLDKATCLFKNKGNSAYNDKFKKFEYMAETPMCFEWKYLQEAKERHLKECP